MLLLCLLGFTIRAESSQSQGRVTKAWPVQFGKRKLYPCEYASIYAGKKSGADQAKKVLEIVVKDLKQAGLTEGHGKSMLCVAADGKIEQKVRRLNNVELRSTEPQSITAMPPEKSALDVAYCSYVLEHVPDDHKPIRAMYKALKPGGVAVVQVPITGQRTLEDPYINTPQGREKRYGSADCYRRYGTDFRFRLEAAGFSVRMIRAIDLAGPEDAKRFGLPANDPVFRCEKRYVIYAPPTSRLVLSPAALYPQPT